MPSDTGVPAAGDPNGHPEILQALRVVHDPCSVATGIPIDIVDMGLIGTIVRQRTTVTIGLVLTSPTCWQAVGMSAAIEAALLKLDGVEEVRCTLDLSQHWEPGRIPPHQRARLRAVRPAAAARPPHPADVSGPENRPATATVTDRGARR